MGNKNGKNRNKKEEVKEEDNIYSELNVLNKKVEPFYNISRLKIKTIPINEEIEYFDIFQNGNILKINILEPNTLNKIFNYKNDKISHILILSKEILLLLIPKEENNLVYSIIVLNIQESKEIPLYTYKSKNLSKSFVDNYFVKLSNNRILLIYLQDHEDQMNIDFGDKTF